MSSALSDACSILEKDEDLRHASENTLVDLFRQRQTIRACVVKLCLVILAKGTAITAARKTSWEENGHLGS